MEKSNIAVVEPKQIETKQNIAVQKKNPTIFYFIIKRLFDIIAGLTGTILLIPITAFLWGYKKITKQNDGPLFYEQLRIGKNGEEFRLYKYRTMCMNADEQLQKYLDSNPEAKEEFRKYKKLKNDPRISKLGKFLRTASIDEFSQFINVLMGNMSLVGPRPYLHREIEDMGDSYYNKIITCKPGITGYWQAHGRNRVYFNDRLKMDSEYIDKRSIRFDIKIIFKTIEKVLGKEGAF